MCGRDPLPPPERRDAVSRPLPLTQKQITALAKGAMAAGAIAEVKIGDVVVRLIPADNSNERAAVDDKGKGHL